jgi:hypothetical protein
MNLGTERIHEYRSGPWFLAEANGPVKLEALSVCHTTVGLEDTTFRHGILSEVVHIAGVIRAHVRVIEDERPHREYFGFIRPARENLRVGGTPIRDHVTGWILIGARHWNWGVGADPDAIPGANQAGTAFGEQWTLTTLASEVSTICGVIAAAHIHDNRYRHDDSGNSNDSDNEPLHDSFLPLETALRSPGVFPSVLETARSVTLHMPGLTITAGKSA